MEINVERKKFDFEGKYTYNYLSKQSLRVAAYARVSTRSDEQAVSFESQQKYYKEKISRNEKWTYVGIYADRGKSATRVEKRTGFLQMITDALKGEIDLILTKSISRFARNTVDALKFVKQLREKNVAVYFEEENINSLDMRGELVLTILCSIAQQESENMSAHVKQGLQMKMKRGEIIGMPQCYGYNYNLETKQLEIDEERAKVIRKIYQYYLEGKGTYKIAQLISNEGYLTAKGNPNWNEGVVTKILRNEKYVGDLILGKTFSSDPFTRKPIVNNGQRDKYYIKNHHEGIIDRDTFNKVQELIDEKRKIFYQRNPEYVRGKYINYFSGKFICGFCGAYVTKMKDVIYGKDKYYCKRSTCNIVGECEESKLVNAEMIKIAFMDLAVRLRKAIKLDTKFSNDITKKLSKARKTLLNMEDLKESKFNEDLFTNLINYIIIGGYTENGKAEPYLLRFILNSECELFSNPPREQNPDSVQIFKFNSKQVGYYFKKEENKRPHQVFYTHIPVTCEVVMKEPRVWKLLD